MLLKILSKRPMINEIADWRGNASSFNRRKTVPNAADQSEEDSLFPGSPVNAMVAEDVRGHRSSIYPLIPWTNVSTETYLPSFPLIEGEDAQS